MKKKYICITLAACLSAVPTGASFAGSKGLDTDISQAAVEIKNESIGAASGQSTASAESAEAVSGGAISGGGESTSAAIEIEGVTLPEKTAEKNLSLSEAIKIMQTTGASAETAQLHKQSDEAVGKGYSETVTKINHTEDKLDLLDKTIAGAEQMGMTQQQIKQFLQDNYGVSSAVELAYNAQVSGATSNNKKIMRLRRDFAKANTENNYQAEMNQIEADTISIYYKVLLAQDSLKIAEDNLAAQRQTLKNTEAKKEVGLLSKKDVLQAQSSVADAESAVRNAQTQLRYAKMSFNYLLGFNVQQGVIFTDTLESAAPGTEAAPADEAVKNALNNRIELKGANLAVKVYEILLDDVKAYPRNSSTYLNAKINLAEAEKTAKDAYSKIEIDVRNKYDALQDKKAAVEAAKELLVYATEGERLMELTNEEGLSTVDELLATQVSLYKAKLNLANCNAEYALAMKSYEFAQGVGVSRIPL